MYRVNIFTPEVLLGRFRVVGASQVGPHLISVIRIMLLDERKKYRLQAIGYILFGVDSQARVGDVGLGGDLLRYGHVY